MFTYRDVWTCPFLLFTRLYVFRSLSIHDEYSYAKYMFQFGWSTAYLLNNMESVKVYSNMRRPKVVKLLIMNEQQEPNNVMIAFFQKFIYWRCQLNVDEVVG